jgi:hypothetical protein
MRDDEHVQVLAEDEMIILKRTYKKRVQSANWNDLSLERDKWLALLKMLMNYGVP